MTFLRDKLLVGAALVGAGMSASAFAATMQATEDFNTDPTPRGWSGPDGPDADTTPQNRQGSLNFGWTGDVTPTVPTPPGSVVNGGGHVNGTQEMGGSFARTAAIASYLTRSDVQGEELNLDEAWSAQADFELTEANRGTFVFGWFTSADQVADNTEATTSPGFSAGTPYPIIGARFRRESTSAISIASVARTLSGGGQTGIRAASASSDYLVTESATTAYRLVMNYVLDDPDTTTTGDSALKISLADVTSPNTILASGTQLVSRGAGVDSINFNRFGIRTVVDVEDTPQMQVYFDNLSYTVAAAVPEPSSLALISAGALMLARRQRKA